MQKGKTLPLLSCFTAVKAHIYINTKNIIFSDIRYCPISKLRTSLNAVIMSRNSSHLKRKLSIQLKFVCDSYQTLLTFF